MANIVLVSGLGDLRLGAVPTWLSIRESRSGIAHRAGFLVLRRARAVRHRATVFQHTVRITMAARCTASQ